MKKSRISRHWPQVFLILILISATVKAAYGYWVNQVQSEWDMAFERSVTVLITGLTPPQPLLEPVPEELEIIEPEIPEAPGPEADILPEESTTGAGAAEENASPEPGEAGGGSDGSLENSAENSFAPADNEGGGGTELTGPENPRPGSDNPQQDGATDTGSPGENTQPETSGSEENPQPEPGAAGGSAENSGGASSESGSGDSPGPTEHTDSGAGGGNGE